MAITAPIQNGTIPDYSKKEEDKKSSDGLGYDQFLQLLCAEMQYQDPLEPTSNTEYVAQLATFSQMEATLNMQNTLESNNANSLVGKYVIVKSTSDATGETTAAAGFVDYVQYEDGKQYLYINNQRYGLEDIYQVADTEYMEAVTLAGAFKTSVLKLPAVDDLTLADKEDVDNLSKVYESLSEYQKSYIDTDTLKKFSALVEKIETLEGVANVKKFTEEVGKLPSADDITLESTDKIIELRKLYDSLSKNLKETVDADALTKFEALEKKIEELGGDLNPDDDTTDGDKKK